MSSISRGEFVSSAARLPLVVSLFPEEVHARVPEIPVKDAQAMRDQFLNHVGNGNLAPDDPVYADRWATAQSDLENHVRLFYGWEAWGNYQHQLALEVYQTGNDGR